jgi:cysteinyl-tRNA synthetase
VLSAFIRGHTTSEFGKKIQKLQALLILFSPKATDNITEVCKVFVCKFLAKYQAHAALSSLLFSRNAKIMYGTTYTST